MADADDDTEKSLRRSYDKLLSRLDHILSDESELSLSGNVAIALDGLLLRLILWGDDIGLEEGIFELVEAEHQPLALATNLLIDDVWDKVVEVENSLRFEGGATGKQE